MTVKKVGIIGCGTIGSHIANALDAGMIKNATLVAIFDVVPENVDRLRRKLHSNPQSYSNFNDFRNSDCDIVVEAASQDAVRNFAAQVLQAGKDIMIMSVGALADLAVISNIQAEARKNACKIFLPTGAIAGIDAVRAVRDLLDSVTLTTTKNPKALAGAPFFETSNIKLEEIKERTMIYDGNAEDAVKAFPANVNVAAVLSLAGIGVQRTRVRIIADPTVSTNQHEIHASGSFGEFRFLINNRPSPENPKTSYLAVLSAVECLRSISDDGIKIGS